MQTSYQQADDQLFSTIEPHNEGLVATIEESQHPKTIRALFNFVIKSNSLKTAIFDCIDADNPYALRILLRCLCEHYLKFTFIFLRYIEEKTDSPGSDFYSFCGADELYAYMKSLQLSESVIGNERALDFIKLIRKFYPEAGNLSKRKLDAKASQFRYREIIGVICRKARNQDPMIMPFLPSILPLYDELSSFVHGGPLADKEMSKFATEAAKEWCHSQAEMDFLIVASIHYFAVVAIAQSNVTHLTLASQLNSIITEFTAVEG